MRVLVYLFLCAFTVVSCARKDSSSSTNSRGGLNQTANPTLIFTVQIRSECSATQATVQLQNAAASEALDTQTVSNGGTVNFHATPGSYVVAALAGSCFVSGALQAVTSPPSRTICLGHSCPVYKISDLSQKAASGAACAWGRIGCTDVSTKGSGSLVVKNAEIRFNAKSDATVSLNLEPTSGNDVLSSAPALNTGWNLQIGKDGSLFVGGLLRGSVSYEAQVNEALMQSEEGFCAPRGQIMGRLEEYLRESGHSDRVVSAFHDAWNDRLPNVSEFCAYPQGSDEIRRAVSDRSSVPVGFRRTWFVLVSAQSTASSKNPWLKNLKKTPKKDAFASLKTESAKKRRVANDPEVTAEETALVFPIEK